MNENILQYGKKQRPKNEERKSKFLKRNDMKKLNDREQKGRARMDETVHTEVRKLHP